MNCPDTSATALLCARADLCRLARPSASLCRRLGLDWAEMEAHAGGLYMASIQIDGPWFNFNAGGIEAAVVEVRAADAWTVVDLLAFVPTVPDRWFVAVGGAPALGMAHGANRASYHGRRPLQLYRTPVEWLQERCFGAVLLDVEAGTEWLASLPLADVVAVRDDEHAKEIDMARRRLGLSQHQRLVVPADDAREAA